MDKLIINCTTGEMEEVAFTPEEIAQREYEASLPPVIPEPTELEKLKVRLVKAENIAFGNSLYIQDLTELLIDMAVI